MNNITQYLENYLLASNANDEQIWENFLVKEKTLMLKTTENIKNALTFLPDNQIVDFHDSTVIGGIKPNLVDDTFEITFRMLAYEKIDNISIKYPYQEIDPIYIKFTFDNKHRNVFHKLAVKSQTILSLVYDEHNLGIIYLDKDYQMKTLSLEGIDLYKNQKVENQNKKKLKK